MRPGPAGGLPDRAVEATRRSTPDRSLRRTQERVDAHPSERDPGEGNARDTAVEVLCETNPGRVERAGRGTAQWGRHRIAADGIEALRTVGMFGTVERADLGDRFVSARRARHVLCGLADAGLVQVRRLRRGQRVVEAVSLTRRGKRLLERKVDPRDPGDPEAQVYRVAAVRPAQVLHDTAVYRAARREWQRIEAGGGRVHRIRNDADLQRLVDRKARRLRAAGVGADRSRSEAAAALGLRLANGRLTLPDVRIEYRQPRPGDGSGASGFVDVEVATRDYRERTLAAKVEAGFRIHAMDADGHLRE